VGQQSELPPAAEHVDRNAEWRRSRRLGFLNARPARRAGLIVRPPLIRPEWADEGGPSTGVASIGRTPRCHDSVPEPGIPDPVGCQQCVSNRTVRAHARQDGKVIDRPVDLGRRGVGGGAVGSCGLV
jgi:hypothetical protein